MPLSLRICGTRALLLGHHPASPWPIHSHLAQGPRSSQSVNRISGKTSLSCPQTSGNSSTSPRLEQNEKKILEPKALPGKLCRETCGTWSNDSTGPFRQGQRFRIGFVRKGIRLSASLPLSARHALCRPAWSRGACAGFRAGRLERRVSRHLILGAHLTHTACHLCGGTSTFPPRVKL